MIDHAGFPVSDFETSKRFYIRALAPLGYKLKADHSADKAAGFGDAAAVDFWIGGEGGLHGIVHIAFTAESRAVVDAFYDAAIAAGGKDNGRPGLRPRYHKNYYAAFVFDPDGHNIEAVCHKPA